MSPLRVAIVHDWLIAGGAEEVVAALHEMYPEAPIYTSYATDEWRQRLDGKVVTGYLQHFPRLRKYVPFLRAWWFSHLNLSDYDLVISSSGAEAKGVRVPADVKHVNYCHAPTHYYWSRYDEYMKHPGFGPFDWLARLGLRLLVGPMRRWDYKAAQRPDVMVANSTYTQSMIKKYYDREAEVVFPPVAIEKFQAASSYKAVKRHGFVITGRQTPYKRVDLAVAACTELNLPLTVFGTGPDHEKLKAMAGPSVSFAGWAAEDEVRKALQSAEAFIFPGIDDFGIAAVEALAAGTPVIAHKAGGALDYVEPGVTGEFFEKQSVDTLVDCLKTFDSKKYTPNDIKKRAQRFSKDNFKKSFHSLVHNVLQ
jgi:glycosyltransferase involved in cell wall biosynthesis